MPGGYTMTNDELVIHRDMLHVNMAEDRLAWAFGFMVLHSACVHKGCDQRGDRVYKNNRERSQHLDNREQDAL